MAEEQIALQVYGGQSATLDGRPLGVAEWGRTILHKEPLWGTRPGGQEFLIWITGEFRLRSPTPALAGQRIALVLGQFAFAARIHRVSLTGWSHYHSTGEITVDGAVTVPGREEDAAAEAEMRLMHEQEGVEQAHRQSTTLQATLALHRVLEPSLAATIVLAIFGLCHDSRSMNQRLAEAMRRAIDGDSRPGHLIQMPPANQLRPQMP